ncbi:MAG: hypothetical protein ABEJ88_05765 [Halobacterium sp.]
MMSSLALAGRSLRHAGLDAVREFAYRTYFAARPRTGSPDPVLDADWDLLVVLDACRADVFREVVRDGDYDSLSADGTAVSPGSTSREWLASVFGDASDDAVEDVTYVTGNPYTTRVLDADRFAAVDDVWQRHWDDDLGTIPPRPLTNAAIRAGRQQSDGRLVVHYMQPHFPSVVAEDNHGGGVALDDWGDQPMSVWEELRFGKRRPEAVWAAYRRNLEAVLDDVELLLENVDAESAVVTADHGNAFGEYHIYGHPGGVGIPALREVPWCETTAVDDATHDPPAEDDADGDADEDVIDDRLESLGYKV